MEDNFVTLAIRTYQRAQMIKTVLEEQGIETVIHNLNLENPEMAVGVRVRIKKNDLPRALKIVEEMESAWEHSEPALTTHSKILLPIDFSDFTQRTIEIAFDFALKMSAEITLLYVYYNPTFTISSNNEMSTYSINDSELLHRTIQAANADANNLRNLLNRKIDAGELPPVKFNFDIEEGVPEDQILEYCKKNRPDLVVMSTHGRKISTELIGSVTAEVMESCNVPVFAVPVNTAMTNSTDIKRVAFLTNFDQKDLIAIDKTIEMFASDQTEFFFIHASDKKVVWDEIMLEGIKAYFASHYPNLITNYALVGAIRDPDILDNYLVNEKINLLAFNTRRRNIFSRLFNPGLVYKMITHSDTPLFVTHV